MLDPNKFIIPNGPTRLYLLNLVDLGVVSIKRFLKLCSFKLLLNFHNLNFYFKYKYKNISKANIKLKNIPPNIISNF